MPRDAGHFSSQMTVRFDADVIPTFKQDGDEWQTRLNDTLRGWLAGWLAGNASCGVRRPSIRYLQLSGAAGFFGVACQPCGAYYQSLAEADISLATYSCQGSYP
jgi:hypothetical protein